MWIFQKKLKQGCNQDWISLGKSLRNTRKMRSVHEVTLICFWLYPHTILRLRLNNFYFQIESKEILSFLSEGKNHQKWCNGGCKKPKCVWDKKGCSGLAPEGSKKPKAEAGNDYMMWWFSNLLYNYLLLLINTYVWNKFIKRTSFYIQTRLNLCKLTGNLKALGTNISQDTDRQLWGTLLPPATARTAVRNASKYLVQYVIYSFSSQ